MQPSNSGTAVPTARTAWAPYAVAFIVTVATLALRELFGDWVGDRRMLILFVLPIIFSAYKGGLGPGLLSTAIAAVGTEYLLLPPTESFFPKGAVDIAEWAMMIVAGVLVSLLSERIRHLRRQADEHAVERDRSKRAMAALRHSETRFAAAFRSSPTVMTLTRAADGCYVEVNDAFLKSTGYRREEVIGRTAVELNLTPSEVRNGLLRDLHKYGSVRDAEIIVRTRSGALQQVLVSMESVVLDGEELVLLIGMDVTEQRNLESRLRQTQKMDSIGLLAGGIAHDFNNVLTVITGASDILLSTLPPEDPSRELLDEVRTAGARAASLTGQLLAFSRQQMLEPKVLDVNAVVADTEKMLRRLLGEDIQLTTSLEPALHSIMVDPGNLVQVIMNLAVNARDAMPTGGQLTIETAKKEFDADYAATHADVAPGHYAMLAISDTGVGIPPEAKERLFEPFFTTKGLGRGTGFGLAVVHGIVTQNGGHVEVYSEEGIGTTFKIYFPAHQVEIAAESEHEQPQNLGGHETILVVEDDPGVRDVAVRSLSRRGYSVLEAAGGTEALTILAEHRGVVDLVLTDVVMPRMSGRELAEIVHADFPELKVIFTSGYTDDSVVRHGILAAEVAFVQKPYTPNSLCGRVRDVLDGR